jgi:hypothetical protein
LLPLGDVHQREEAAHGRRARPEEAEPGIRAHHPDEMKASTDEEEEEFEDIDESDSDEDDLES